MNTAQTILNQLGGNKFIAMTGSSSFGSTENALHMKLTRNKAGANKLVVTLNSMDTYDLKFMSIRGASVKVKKEVEGVYNDQLQSIFTDVTGLYTSL